MPSLFLPNVSVVIIDTLSHELAERALARSLAAIRFGAALFISDRACREDGVRNIQIPPLASRDAYSRFVMRDLLAHVQTDHALLIQWDGYVVNPAAWSDDFLACDYIGARWGFHKDEHCVGNGGFSLRSRKLLEALQDPQIDRFEPEDEMICRHYRPMLESRHGIRFAPPEVADRFAFETTYPNGTPLGFHGLFNMWKFVGDDEMPAFVGAMPASTLGSIQFRQLARNLIDLKRLAAARVLLERRLAAFPADTETAGILEQLRAHLDRPPPAQTARTPGAEPRTSRNAPCPCGSGKRFKHCCGAETVATQEATIVTTGPAATTASPPPANVEALAQQAFAHHQAGRLTEARQAYEAALAVRDDPLLLHYLGVLDMQQGQPEKGEARIRAALTQRADVPDMHNNLGLCLRAQDRIDEALAAYRAAVALNPGYAPGWNNLGLDSHRIGRYDEAMQAFDKALALSPQLAQARFSRALLLLTHGDFVSGWADYEHRARCPEYASSYRLPRMESAPAPWRGEADKLEGKRLLLIAEQGIGDTIQFIRYANALSAQGGTVNLYTRKPETARLLRSAPGLGEIYTADEPVPAHDFGCYMMSLPRLCGTLAVASIPAEVPYLAAPQASRATWRTRIDSLPPASLRIGLCWAGNPAHANDRNRSCPLATLAPLFEIENVHWISLQVGAGREQLAGQSATIFDWTDELGDYAETAALISELDLVISVDTSVAHAAGALGIPTWVLLPHVADFRWLLERDDSPWYPTMRLFRQTAPSDWAGLARALTDALRQHSLK